MSEYLSKTHGIATPHVVRNVFPRADVDGIAPPAARAQRSTVALVWISATIGPGRGLEDMLRALSLLPAIVRLTVIGRMLPSYSNVFSSLVSQFGLTSRVSLRPTVEGSQIIRTLAEFDIGLSSDGNDCLNRSLTISNKFFQYLQAGLAIIATDTPGHVEMSGDIGPAQVLYSPGDAHGLAEKILPYILSRDLRIAAQQRAWEAGKQRYNWEIEQREFLSVMESVVPPIAAPIPMS
jgi:glycosyltransferase involved in cell wall biosynthesis